MSLAGKTNNTCSRAHVFDNLSKENQMAGRENFAMMRVINSAIKKWRR